MKKNILIAVYDMEIGGIERSLINMLNSFDYEAFDVDLLVCSHQGEFLKLIPSSTNLLPEIKDYTAFRKTIKSCLLEGHYSAFAARMCAKAVANVKARARGYVEGASYIQMQLISKYMNRILPDIPKQYDLCISYAWPHDVIVDRVKAAKKVAWIHTDYSVLEIDREHDLKIWSRFDYIASISDACSEAFLKSYPSLRNKLILIENITSPAYIKQMSEEINELAAYDDQYFNIVSVGRLSYTKGFDLAIQALRILQDKGLTKLKWHIVGYGGYENELRRLVAEHRLESCFILHGKLANPYPVMKRCDLYVQPSRYEGKAVTVTEAQILERPVLITNYPTASSQVENGEDGIICELSVEGLANAIERLYKDEALRISLSMNLSKKNYTNEYELEKLYGIIN